MKTCGQCKNWGKWRPMYCGANAPAWADNHYTSSFRWCASDNEQADGCDCFVRREPKPTTEPNKETDR